MDNARSLQLESARVFIYHSRFLPPFQTQCYILIIWGPLIIREEIGLHLLGDDQGLVPISIAFIGKRCCVFLGFILCV